MEALSFFLENYLNVAYYLTRHWLHQST